MEALLLPNNEIHKPLPARYGPLLRQLRPDTRVVRHHGILLDVREVLLDLLQRLWETGGVDGEVSRGVDPLDIGPEADAAGQVECEVRAQAAVAGLRGRVDEVGGAGSGRGVGEVVALGIVGGLMARGWEDHVVDGTGAEAGGVDYGFCGEGGLFAALVVAGGDFPALTSVVTQGPYGCYG